METRGAKLEGARTELAAARAEVARLEAEYSKSWEDALMEASCLQAWTEASEKKDTETAEEVVAARVMALSEYQSSAEFRQVCEEQYDEGVRAFLFNVWR